MVQKRREIVKEMCNNDKNGEEIYEKLKELGFDNITRQTVNSDISYLKKCGEIEKTPNEKIAEKVQKRREIVKTMHNNDKTRKQILEELKVKGFSDITLQIVDSDIKYLKSKKEILEGDKEKRKDKKQRRREIVKREYNMEGDKRKTREEIKIAVEQEMGIEVSLKTIDEDISYWRRKGELLARRKKEENKERKEKIRITEQKIEEIVQNGVVKQKTEKQIQEEIKEKLEIEISLETVYDIINYLEIEGKIESKNPESIMRKRREVELYKQGMIIEDIQSKIKKEFNVKLSLAVIYQDISPYINLEEQLELPHKMPHRELRRRTKTKCQQFYGQTKFISIFRRYMNSCQIRFKNNVLEKEDLSVIKEVATLTQNYQDIAFYLKVAVQEEQFEEAIDFINDQVGNEVFTEQEEKAIISLKQKVERFVQYNTAKKMLEKGFNNINEIAQATRLHESEVTKINEKLIQEKQDKTKELKDLEEEERLA